MFKKIDRPLITITIFSIFLCILLWYWCPIAFFPDSEQYLRTAFAITNQPGEYYYFRTWGYPLILVLFGVTKFHTFYALLTLQAMLGIAIPIVIYATVNFFNKKAAILTALISAISFTPFIWQKCIMTDQVSMFLYYLLAYAAVRFIFHPTYKNNGLLFIVGWMLYLMRPSAMLIFLCTMAWLLLFHRQVWRQIILSCCIFLVSVVGFQFFQVHTIRQYNDVYQIKNSFSKGSMVGRMFFYNVYGAGPFFTHSLTVEPTNGKCSLNLYNSVIRWGTKLPAIKKYYFGNQSPTEIAHLLFNQPNLYNHSILWLIMDQNAGSVVADRVFACAAFEGLLKHPKALELFPIGFIQFFMSGDIVYNTGKMVASNVDGIATALTVTYLSTDHSFSTRLLNELRENINKHNSHLNISRAIYKFLFYWQTTIKVIAILIALLFLPFCFFVHNRQLACMASLIALYLTYQAAVAVTFAAPHFRYISPQIPLMIMLAGLGIYAWNIYRQHNKKLFD